MATSGEFQGSYESFHEAFRLILPFTIGMTLRDVFSEESPLRGKPGKYNLFFGISLYCLTTLT